MAKSPEELAQTMIDNLAEKTGHTLEQWLVILSKQTFSKHGEIVKHLKQEHEVTHGFANLIAAKALEMHKPVVSDEEVVAAQYKGAKAGLRPIYDALIGAVAGFGQDVEIAPKKTYVSLRRHKQFAIIQPSTKTRLDVGIQCKATKPTDRLETSGSFNAMVSHRVRLTDVSDVDDQLIQWLRDAYEDS